MHLRVVAVAFLFCGGLAWADPVPAGAAEVVVRIGGALDPAEVTVVAGTVVRWVNEDGDRHRVRSSGGPTEFDSGNLEPGDSFTLTFSGPGRTTYLDDRDRSAVAYHGAVTVTSGGGGSGGGAAGPAPAPSSSAPPPSSTTITMANRAFSPPSIVIAPGGTITWKNADDRDHTGTAQGGAFDTGNVAPGATATTSHPSEGTFSFFCELHPEMSGVVRVSSDSGAAPAPTPPPAPTPGPPASAEPPPPPLPVTAAGAGPSTRHVRIGDLFFAPAAIDLRVGDAVVWTNTGRAPHTATSGSFDSGRLASGGTFRWTAPTAGTIAYGCTLHPEMTGTLRILAASAAAPPVPAATTSEAATAPAATAPAATGPPDAAAPGDVPPLAPASVDVEVRDFSFAPSSVRVAAGGTVRWSFAGVAPHTATGEGFDSGVLGTGATYEHTFAEPGTFAYSCAVHPDMTGAVEVVEAALVSIDAPSPAPPPAGNDGTQAWTVALLGGAGILGGTGALLLGARRFVLAS